MNDLNPRAIAVQGVGFQPRLVGLQGLWPVSDEPTDPDPPVFAPRRRKKQIRHDTDDDVLLFLLK